MKKAIGVIIALIIIVAAGLFAFKGLMDYRNAETTEVVDYTEAYRLSEDQYTVTFNNVLQNYHAIGADGAVYLELTGVTSEINNRFYFDQNEYLLIYTLPAGNTVAKFGQTSYTDPSGSKVELGYEPIKAINNKVYVAIDYIKNFTNYDIQVYQEPNRVVIHSDFGDHLMVDATEDTYIRQLGGPKSPAFREVKAGETFYLLDDSYVDWKQVASSDGYIGWMTKKTLSDPYTKILEAPAYDEPVYATLQRDHKIKMVWHQVMYEAANDNFDSAFANVTGINVVAPTWFAFNNQDGDIRSIASYDYVAKAHERGMEVWALFSNEFPDEYGDLQGFSGMGVPTDEVLSHTSKRANAISQIIGYCMDYGIDGINMDFENIIAPSEDGTGKSAENFLQFVRELSVACHANNLVLSIDNYVPLYTQHYNRSEESAFADYLVIMGYDEYYAGGVQAGPNASIPFVEQGITDTMAAGVPASKIINGIPFYTRYWYTSGGELYCDDASMGEALDYANSHGVTPRWDENLGVNYVSYEGSDGNTYQMWLEDLDAVARKMQLINSYDLGGVSCWKLGQEVSEVWSVINQYMP